MRYRYIAFDIDGTLLDSSAADLAGLEETLRTQMGLALPTEALVGALGIPSRDILEKFGVPPEKIEPLSRMWADRMYAHFDRVRVFPGIEQALERLCEAGARVGVVTSKNGEEYARDMSPFGLEKYFCTVVTASDTRLHKPNPEPLLEYMRRIGARREQTLYIGDSVYDRDCARGAGVDFALAVWGSFSPDMEGAKWYPRQPEALLEIARGGVPVR